MKDYELGNFLCEKREQDMLFKYKWNKAGNEPHPYH